MDPAEETELLLQISALEGQHEADEAEGVERKADEAVVGRETSQLGIREDNML